MKNFESALDARTTSQKANEALDVLVFRIGDERFAVPLAHVQEMLRSPRVTPVPRVSKDIAGILALRGCMLTIFDLRRVLQKRDAPITSACRVLVAALEGEPVGWLVDSVDRVLVLKADDIEAPTALGERAHAAIQGICRPKEPRLRTATRDYARSEEKPEDLILLLDPRLLIETF